MGDIAIGINPTTSQGLFASLGGYKEFLNTLTSDLLRQEAALSARAFIMFTAPIPYGGGSGDSLPAKKQGEIAVERDIRSMIAPKDFNLAASVDKVYGDITSFEKWKSKRLKGNVGSIIMAIHADTNTARAYQKAQNLYSGSTGLRNLASASAMAGPHNSQRASYRGRITRHRGPSADIKAKPYFAEAVDIDAYIKKRQLMVGKMSAGWWTVLQRIGKIQLRGMQVTSGVKDLLGWIKRHNTPGFVNETNMQNNSPAKSITIVNLMGDAVGVATESRTKLNVVMARIRAIASRPYDRILRDGIRQFNAGSKRPL
jgi:hypothetical protein